MCPIALLNDVEAYNGLDDSYIKVPQNSLALCDTGSTVTYVKQTFSDALLKTGHALLINEEVDLKIAMLGDNRTALTTDLVLLRLSLGNFSIKLKCLVIKEIVREMKPLCPHTLSTLDSVFSKHPAPQGMSYNHCFET